MFSNLARTSSSVLALISHRLRIARNRLANVIPNTGNRGFLNRRSFVATYRHCWKGNCNIWNKTDHCRPDDQPDGCPDAADPISKRAFNGWNNPGILGQGPDRLPITRRALIRRSIEQTN